MTQIPTTNLKKNQPSLIRDKSWGINRIINAYRRKILVYYPLAVFDTEYVLGISTSEWADIIELNMQPGMTWENYGIKWHMWCIKNAKEFDIKTPEGFYSYYRYSNYRPRWKSNAGFMADPNGVSPLDRDGN